MAFSYASQDTDRASRDYSVTAAGAPAPAPLPPASTQKVFNGTAGNNTIHGTGGPDTFNMGQGGNDTVFGNGGKDVFNFGGALTRNDKIDGGGNDDTLNLNGKYLGAHAVVFNATTMKNVETLHLADNSYKLTLNDGNVAANKTLTVDSSATAANRFVSVNGAAEHNGHFTFLAGAGQSFLTGGAKNDTFSMGAFLNAPDRINGGPGDDTVNLAGDYSGAHALTFGANTMKNVETLHLDNHNYTLTTNDGNVASGQTLTVDARALGASRTLTFDGSAEQDGAFNLLLGNSHVAVTGGAGSDTFAFTDGFSADDRLDGGTGGATLSLDGDYSFQTGGVVFGPDTIHNVEKISVAAGHNYALALDSHNLGILGGMTVDGSALGAFDSLFFDGSAAGRNFLFITGGAGDDILYGGGRRDIITMGGGRDQIYAGGGDDSIDAGRNFDIQDTIDGGAGNDTLFFSDGTGGFINGNVTDVERFFLGRVSGGSGDYHITFGEFGVPFGHSVTVDGRQLDSDDHMVADASGGSTSTGEGNVTFLGGPGIDTITIGIGGFDVVKAGSGDDLINAKGNLQETDRIDGGASVDDELNLSGDYSDRLQFQSHTMRNIEHLSFAAGHNYNIALSDGNVASGQTLQVEGGALGSGNHLIFDGSRESNGHFNIIGGAGADTIRGGAAADTIRGGAAADTIAGGGGGDIFVYGSAAESTSTTRDTIFGLNLSGSDRFDLPVTITSVEFFTNGTAVNSGNFDANLATGTSGHILANKAVLYTPTAGDLANHTFLVVDFNGVAGYQAGADLVVDVTGVGGGPSTDDFI